MRVRPATSDDYDQFTRFFAEFGLPDPTPTRDWWERSLPNAIFLEDGDQLIAYGLAYTLGHDLGYVMHVVVDPGVRNRGVGRVLMGALREKLREAGCTSWNLNVLVDNAAAIALYRRSGMEIAYATESLLLAWADVAALPQDPSISAELLLPERDAEVERAFGLPAGRLTTARAVPGRVVVHTQGGVTVFDPAFPGSPIFRAKSVQAARALLEALRPHRRIEDESLRIAVEDDAALVSALQAAGAKPVRSLLNMRGAL